MAHDLYPNALLALAADIPHLGLLPEADGLSHKRSMVCGSEVTVSVALDAHERIAGLGLDVQACALGQASASVFARNAIGASLDEVRAGRDALTALLKTGAAPDAPRFVDLAVLAPIQDYPRRHASTLLAWRAAVEAMEHALDIAPVTSVAQTSRSTTTTP